MHSHTLGAAVAASIALFTGIGVAHAQSARALDGLAGRVTARGGSPVAGAEVALVQAGAVRAAVRTDTAGAYALALAAGPRDSLRVRRFGYRPRTVAAADPGARAVIALEPVPAELDTVTVLGRATAMNARLREFHDHRARARFGSFFDADDIVKRHPRYLSDLMRFVPGSRLIPGRIGSVVRLRGCRPLLWIDGIRVPGAELDEVVNMQDVAAVEVYNSFAGIPAQYVDRNTNCGAVVVWLKS